MLRFVRRTAPGNGTLEGLPEWLAALLVQRGVDTREKAQRFLHPSMDQMHDPFLMQGMEDAVALIRKAAADRASVVVYGDYDVDGVCAASMLRAMLRDMGAAADYYIPSRHEEGYGLNEQAIRALAKDYSLLVTVDCGITGTEEVKLARELGMQVIVTDHHQLGPELPPADAVLNPLMGEYPFRRLCGAGVVLKLIHALGGILAAAEYLDLAALATIADLVPMTEENRVIAALGLERLSDTKRPGLAALMEAAGMDGKTVRAGQVAFQLAPRINAGGRLKSASLGAELILTSDAAQARQLAQTLNEENARRQKLEAEIFGQALLQVEAETDFVSDRVLIAVGEGWNSGVIGLAASRLTERFHYPSIVLSQTGEECVGSARSIPGVNIHEMLSCCRDLFSRFGGHEQAAGLTMPARHVKEMRRRLSEAICQRCDPEAYVPAREYDLELSLHEVTGEMAQTLQVLQPTGLCNPEPVFLLKDAQVQDMRPVGREGAHLKCSLYKEGAMRPAIAFQMGKMAAAMPGRVDALFSPELNEWNGSVSVQCNIKAIRPGAMAQIPGGEEQAQTALLQEIRELAPNMLKVHPAHARADDALLQSALSGAQGTVILARALKTARRISLTYGEKLAAADGAMDRRGFHTLLYPARLSKLTDMWRTVVLADGELLPGEASLIQERCPRARVLVFDRSRELADFLKPLALGDEALRLLYRAAKSIPGATIAGLAETAGMTAAQAKAGLYILSELDLLSFAEEPFSLTMHPPVKRSLEDSLLLRALKAAAV